MTAFPNWDEYRGSHRLNGNSGISVIVACAESMSAEFSFLGKLSLNKDKFHRSRSTP